jgi:hypothetical protein
MGSLAVEYAEAALDRLYAELRAAAGLRTSPRPLADPALAALVEEIEADAARTTPRPDSD